MFEDYIRFINYFLLLSIIIIIIIIINIIIIIILLLLYFIYKLNLFFLFYNESFKSFSILVYILLIFYIIRGL